ncbi:hypothetical protein [Micromonospora zamorensis]|uniref:hypothetical protein n=1 Tax=Micromonospora zamorensis TaxID=709883 RepID=UPI003CF40C8D
MILEQAHRKNSASPVSTPDERGRFAPAMLPEVFPVVVDANALRDDLLRRGGLIGALNALLGVAADGLFHGAFATARRVPWPWLVVGALATVGTIRYLVAPDTRPRLQTVLGTSLSSVSAAVAEVLAHREDAKRQFATLLPGQPGWHEITEHRNPAATLTRACLHHLARSPHSDLSAKELTELLRRTGDVAAGEARVRSTLRGMAAFSEPGRGRFQVGGVVSPPSVG